MKMTQKVCRSKGEYEKEGKGEEERNKIELE